jgi:hypothetical protein
VRSRSRILGLGLAALTLTIGGTLSGCSATGTNHGSPSSTSAPTHHAKPLPQTTPCKDTTLAGLTNNAGGNGPDTGCGTAPAPEQPRPRASACKNPDGINRYHIRDMKVGEKCYTVGWAMREDGAGKFWLNPTLDAAPTARGTLHMEIIRHPNGFEVSIDKLDEEEKYEPGTIPPGYLPVITLNVN